MDEACDASWLAFAVPRNFRSPFIGLFDGAGSAAQPQCALPGASPENGARVACYFRAVTDRPSFDELARRIEQAFRDSPVQDIAKNLRALLAAWFDRMDLVLREDFEVQKKLLERSQARLAELERRIAELEARAAGSHTESRRQ